MKMKSSAPCATARVAHPIRSRLVSTSSSFEGEMSSAMSGIVCVMGNCLGENLAKISEKDFLDMF